MRILISNDDGVYSPGILALANELKKIPKAKITVVAPDREQSGTSHALTLHRPLRIQKMPTGFYAVDGTPTDAVMMGVEVIMKKERPDLVVSGINHGANLGEDVHYSGTVAAAIEGAIKGIPAIAISLVGPPPFKFVEPAKFARRLVTKALKHKLPPGIVLNVNIPSKLKSASAMPIPTCLGKHNYGGVIVEKTDPRGRAYYWIGGNPMEFEDRPGSDGEGFQKKKITITPLKIDMTDYSYLAELKTWKWGD